jgi:hypothetical protein
VLDLWARTDRGTTNFARNRQATEASLELRLDAVFLQSIIALPLSSRETAGARMGADSTVIEALRRVVARAEKRESRLTEAMEVVRLRYVMPVYGEGGLLSVFAPKGNASPLERYLGFVPAAVYTGLVVYVKGEYTAYGRSGATASLKTCLLPRIYDTDLRLVLDATQVDRSSLLNWGMVAYSNDLDEVPYANRVGQNPLRTVARGVYGEGDMDIVISREAARFLASRDENLALLRQGRVLVVLDATAPPEDLQTKPEELPSVPEAGGML